MADIDVRSPVTGTVWKVVAAAGDTVAADAELVIIESMKMEIPVEAPAAGDVVEVLVGEGEPVTEDQVVARIRTA